MSYISITDLPELQKENIKGLEYLLVTDVETNSNKLQMNTLTEFISDEVTQNVNDTIDEKLTNASINSKVIVYDEGTEVGSTNKINFIGAVVNSFINEDDGSVDVYIPSAVLSSHFNTQDGGTDAIIPNASYENRYVSAPAFDGTPFSLGNWAPGTLQKCIKDNLSYSVPEKFYVDKISMFKLSVFQNNQEIESLQFNIENGVFNSQNISATISNKTKEMTHYTCNFTCFFNLSQLVKGRFQIKIKYSGNIDSEFVEDELFFDSDPIPASILNSFSTNNYYNYLSGIKYLGTGTQINSEFTLKNSKNYTYPLNLMDIDGSLAGINSSSINVTDINLFTYPFNSDVVINKVLPILNNKFYFGDLIIKSRVNDWVKGNFISSNIRALICTLTDTSTRVYEDFNSETFRLKSDFTSFNSQELQNNDLQVFNSKLVYPQLDFSEFYNNPDYRSKTGTRTFIRKFYHFNISHSNGLFQLSSNITEADLLSEKVKIEISLDSINWFNCNKDYQGGVLVNGSNCRINSDTNSLNINNKMEFTLGLNKFTNLSSNWGIFMKITILEEAKDKYIESIQITNWN